MTSIQENLETREWKGESTLIFIKEDIVSTRKWSEERDVYGLHRFLEFPFFHTRLLPSVFLPSPFFVFAEKSLLSLVCSWQYIWKYMSPGEKRVGSVSHAHETHISFLRQTIFCFLIEYNFLNWTANPFRASFSFSERILFRNVSFYSVIYGRGSQWN